MRFNPFRPNSIVGPGMFSGRSEEINTIEQSLFQTKHGNPQHFLIQGERGIGKSSLLLVVDNLAKGAWKPFDNEKFDFLSISIDIGGAQSQLDIIKSIAKELKDEIGKREKLKKHASQVWDFITNWEIMGVRYHRATDIENDDIRDALVENLAALVESDGFEHDGISILIDEADGPAEAARLGEFAKLFTERLSRRRCNKVVLGLAGLPTLIPRLRTSHESAPRVFEAMKLDPLEMKEREYVITRGLEDAKVVNKVETKLREMPLG
jgi:Cdc6-like AAA superfamily ATPase